MSNTQHTRSTHETHTEHARTTHMHDVMSFVACVCVFSRSLHLHVSPPCRCVLHIPGNLLIVGMCGVCVEVCSCIGGRVHACRHVLQHVCTMLCRHPRSHLHVVRSTSTNVCRPPPSWTMPSSSATDAHSSSHPHALSPSTCWQHGVIHSFGMRHHSHRMCASLRR